MQILLSFFIYSFMGWAIESTYCSVLQKRWINRGFLNGPFCPIYACGALAVVGLLKPIENFSFSKNIVLLYFFGVFITSLLEYVVGYILETLFKTKWWDYSKNKFNIKGRVCLKNSLMFGLLAVLLIKIIHPFVIDIIYSLPIVVTVILDVLFVSYFAWDITVTLCAILHMNNMLERLQESYVKARAEIEQKLELERATWSKKLEPEHLKFNLQLKQTELLNEFREKFSKKAGKFSQGIWRSERHLMRAFPTMKSHRYTNALEEIKKVLSSLKRY